MDPSAATHGLEVTEAKSPTVLAPVVRPKRRKMNPLDLKDARELFGLPEGWEVEERARTSAKYVGKVDKYFYDPVTRKQFRSLKSVFLYFRWKMQQKSEPPSQFGHFKCRNQKSSNEQSQEKKRTSSLNLGAYPPEKITWVLIDDEKQNWSPYIEQTKVPDGVKLGWADFFLFINGGN